MQDLSEKRKHDQKGKIVQGWTLIAIIILAIMGILYKSQIVPREGYRYTIGLIVNECSTLRRGEGYVVKYSAGGQRFLTRCDPCDLKLVRGRKYLLKYAKANPIYYTVLSYEFVDGVEAPKDGWEELPQQYIKPIE